ncbi:MAG: amidohydrolase family protein [Planctomycetota bacterium]
MRYFGRIAAIAAAWCAVASASAQPTGSGPLTEPQNGPRVTDPGRHLIIGGTVHLAPGEVIPAEQIPVIRIEDGAIAAIIADSRMVAIDPSGFRVWQLDDDDHVYAGFIEPWFEVEGQELDEHRPGRHWSHNVTPERDVLAGPGLTEGDRESLRALGFVAAAIAPDGGIFRGHGAVVSTADVPENPASDRPTVYRVRAFNTIEFVTSGWGGDLAYPTSQMGAHALIRQVLSDLGWQQAARDTGSAVAPNALDSIMDTDRFVFETDHEQEVLQADAAFDGIDRMIIVGSGTEIRRLDAIAETGRPMILPLRYPRKPDVTSVGKAASMELETLMLWEQSPATAGRVAEAGITAALTSSKSRDRGEFHENLIAAIEHGLSPEDALAMLTTVPAALMGVDDRLGRIEMGRPANLVVSSEPLFDPSEADEAEIRDVWIEGVRHEINDDDDSAFDGAWAMRVGPDDAPTFEMQFEVDDGEVTLTEDWQDDEPATSDARGVEIGDTSISFLIDDEDDGSGSYVVSGTLSTDADGSERIFGSAIEPGGGSFAWHAVCVDAIHDADDDNEAGDESGDEVQGADEAEDAESPEIGSHPGYPFGPYAVSELPEQRSLVLMNATVWTSGPAGIIENGYVVIDGGRITEVGPMPDGDLPIPAGFDVVSLEGRHITPGLVDAHSHTGTWTFGTNEAGQAVTAEVRMADTNDPDHINWYRQLAAGVTTVNTLHGSANPIGGQNLIQKVRWGVRHPRDTHMLGATPGIKFALGENVVQVNWGDRYTSRYPKTRMGVDALMRDRFNAARDYALAWHATMNSDEFGNLGYAIPETLAASFTKIAEGMLAEGGELPEIGELPRRDYELDALAEILAGDRLVHCHSYRQDEIVMLANIARDFGFTIGSYQHGLETYKVAEAVKAHSLGGSLFSDWWAYKVEVQDAIPYAGPILWETGTRVSFNSDSDNLVRRLNTEATKMIKYGKDLGLEIPPADALAVVTINPAVQLGIGDRVGSIEVGKDADLAVWSGDPLSSLSRCLHTIIDGREYWSESIDEAHRERIASERARLIAKLIEKPGDDGDASDIEASEGEAGTRSDEPERPERRLAQRILLDNLRAHHRRLWLEGKDLGEPMRPGDCGCGMAHMGVIQ